MKAIEVTGKKVYVYQVTGQGPVTSFRSIRETCKTIPISPSTLARKLDSGLPFKGYYYYSYDKNK